MKQVKRKEHLKKLIFIQHITIGTIISVGVIFIVTKSFAQLTRNDSTSTGDVFNALYSGENNIYTSNMSGYNNQCSGGNMTFIEITGSDNKITILPQLITDNTIYILSGGKFSVINKTVFSGSCIAFVGRGNVEFAGIIDTDLAKYSIIDNIIYHNNLVNLPEYTTSTGIDIYLENNITNTINYIITGDISTQYTGTITTNSNITKQLNLNKTNSGNQITTIFHDTYNILNRQTKYSTHDNITPILTGKTIGITVNLGETQIEEPKPIQNNGLYNIGIKIEISDINLSGIYNNSVFLSGGNIVEYNNNFITEGIYNIIARDKAGNQTGISFEIDTTAPAISGLQPSSGSTYTGTSLLLSWQVNESTANIKSQTYYLYNETTTTFLKSGNVIPGNTGIRLIDINTQRFNRKVVIEDKAGNISTGSVPTFNFNKTNSVFTGTNANIIGNTGYINTDPIIYFSGNKTFSWYLYTGATGPTYFIRSGEYNTIGVTTGQIIPRIGGNTGTLRTTFVYKTSDNEIGTGIFNFYIDKTIPTLGLNPSSGRRNSTGDILYSRSGLNKQSWMIKNYTFYINGILLYSGNNLSYNKTGIQTTQEYRAQVCATDISNNHGCSQVQKIIIDQTPPTITNVISGGFYRTVPNPAPIISDDSLIINTIIVKRNGIVVLQTGMQESPYGIILQPGEALYEIITSDEAGNTNQLSFSIDTTIPTINLINPISGSNITGTNTITFNRSGYDRNFSGYEFVLSGYSYGNVNVTSTTTGTTKIANNLNNGSYQRRITIFDKAGNRTKSPTNNFQINVALTGQITLGSTIKIGNINYSNTNMISLLTNINKPTTATITGNIIGQDNLPIINQTIVAGNQTTPIQLTTGEGQKNIYIKLLDSVGETIYSHQQIFVDKTGPSKPILTSINNRNYTGNTTITRPISTDNGVGIKEYNYIIQQGFSTVKSGTGTNPSISLQNMELGLQGTYTITTRSTDLLGNQSERSEIATFNYNGIPDTSPEIFTFARQADVNLNTIYRSNSINISGLTNNTFITANIDTGTLFVNGINANKQAQVKNGDILYIELRSSDEYYTVTVSAITIGDKSAIFKLITKSRNSGNDNNDDDEDDDGELSVSEIIELEGLYLLIENLDNNLKKTLKDMMEEKIDELIEEGANEKEIAKLLYIYDRLVDDINDSEDSIYKAPNGKKYTIVYKKGLGYTSTNFSASNQTKYFTSSDEIEKFIDKNNPGTSLNYDIDESRSTSVHKTPNGKTYNFFKTTTGKYSSYNMVIQKLFNSLQELKTYLDKNNPKK